MTTMNSTASTMNAMPPKEPATWVMFSAPKRG